MADDIVPDALTVELGNTFAGVTGNMMIALLEQSQDCVKLMQPDGTLGFMNRNGRCSMEIDDFCAVEGTRWWEMWPAEAQPVVRQAVSQAAAGQDSRFEAFCPTAKGTAKWWDVTVSPVRDDQGKIFQIVSFSRDVTDQVRDKEALRTMAFEMRHRLRNAFTVSSAIAMISARDAPEHAAFARQLAQRYAALAQAQSQLLDSADGPMLLADLLAVMIAPYAQIRCDCPDGLVINEHNARVTALALGELATNSMKYGALSLNSPVVIAAAERAGRLILTWHEAELGQPAPGRDQGGSGHGLIERMVNAYKGSFALDWSAQSLTAAIDLPA